MPRGRRSPRRWSLPSCSRRRSCATSTGWGSDMERPKILVVDDETTNLELLERMLRSRYAVSTAQSAAQALELLRRERFAAILSDQRMPGMSGTDFLAEAKRLVPETVRMIL